MGPLGGALLIGMPLALILGLAVQWQRPSTWAYEVGVGGAMFGSAVKNAASYPGVALLAASALALVGATARARCPASERPSAR